MSGCPAEGGLNPQPHKLVWMLGQMLPHTLERRDDIDDSRRGILLVRTEQVYVSPKWQQQGSLVRFSFYYGQEAGLGENSYLLGWGRTERRV